MTVGTSIFYESTIVTYNFQSRGVDCIKRWLKLTIHLVRKLIIQNSIVKKKLRILYNRPQTNENSEKISQAARENKQDTSSKNPNKPCRHLLHVCCDTE